MKRLPLVALLALAALPSTSTGAGCSPLSCSPTASPLTARLLAVRPFGVDGPVRVLDLATGKTRWRLPSGILSGRTLVHQDGTLLTWFDAATGARTGDAAIPQRGRLALVGTSSDGRLAVLARTQTRRTTFAIDGPRSTRTVVLGGNAWGFDALSGSRLYLLQYLRNGYEVRLYDLARNRLDPQPLKDAKESALIEGTAWERIASRDGRYLFTLYVGASGATMIHELDLRAPTARCIDLPGDGDFNAGTGYGIALSPDGRTLWAVSPGYGKVVGIDVASARVRVTFGFPRTAANGPVASTSAVSPDGARLAVALAGDLWFVDLAAHRVVKAKPHAAIAIGFAPDGTKLWAVASRVSALRVP